MTAARIAFAILFAVALGLLVLLLRPFASALFLAAVFAGALHPSFYWLRARLGGRGGLAAALFTFAFVLAVVIPVSLIGTVVVRQMLQGFAWFRATLQSEGVPGLLMQLPDSLRELGARALDALPASEDQLLALTGQGGKAAAAAAGVVAATSRALLQTVLMLIAFFFFLADGDRLIAWLNEASPLEKGQLPELLDEFRRVSATVLLSTAATALAQSIVALAGYLVAGVPSPFFFGFVTFFLAFIPGGCGLLSLVLAGLLAISGHPGWAVFLAVWGVGVVSLVDNVVKPLVIRGGVHLHGAVIFFALLGGLAAFGPVGLVAGPLVVTFFLALVRMYERDRNRA